MRVGRPSGCSQPRLSEAPPVARWEGEQKTGWKRWPWGRCATNSQMPRSQRLAPYPLLLSQMEDKVRSWFAKRQRIGGLAED